MPPNVSSYILSGPRGKILLVVTAFFLLTILISFRGVVTDAGAWRASVTPIENSKEPELEAITYTPSATALATHVAEDDKDAAQKIPGTSTTAFISSSSTTIAAAAAAATTTSSASDSKSSESKADASIADKSAPTFDDVNSKMSYDCKGFPDTSDILLIMKTGATEAYDKLPIHFMTTLRCVNDSIIFSDMEMDMAGYHLVDVLANITDEVKKDNNDFELYETLQDYRKWHEDPRALKVGMNGWNLDKYKFVPMMTKTWDYRKDASWYVFVEADTGIIWDNLRRYLDTLDSNTPYYIGSPTYLDIEFAHGGTGYAISQAAMKLAVGGHSDLNERYNQWVQPICCGDRMIARILLDEEIKLTKAWPMFNGEKPLTLPFGERQWCQPVITMHHMTAQEVSQVWVFDQKRKAKGITDPMVWKDVFNYFVKDNLFTPSSSSVSSTSKETTSVAGDAITREDWDNLSNDIKYTPDPERDFGGGRKWADLSDIERESPQSADRCKAMCEYDAACFQWLHHGNECKISHAIKLGGSRRPENNEKWTSGWQLGRIEEFRKKMGECEKGIDWKTSGP